MSANAISSLLCYHHTWTPNTAVDDPPFQDDFTIINVNITFGPSGDGEMTVDVPITNDTVAEPTEEGFLVVLEVVDAGGASIELGRRVTVGIIRDDDSKNNHFLDLTM